jgi:hypothetical protein
MPAAAIMNDGASYANIDDAEDLWDEGTGQMFGRGIQGVGGEHTINSIQDVIIDGYFTRRKEPVIIGSP